MKTQYTESKRVTGDGDIRQFKVFKFLTIKRLCFEIILNIIYFWDILFDKEL